MRALLGILLIGSVAYSHAALCQEKAKEKKRFVLKLKRPPRHVIKTVVANVNGIVCGSISKDSLLKYGKVTVIDRQKRFDHMKVIAFEMVVEKKDTGDSWKPIKRVKKFSYFDGDTFSDEMLYMIKKCGKDERIVLYVTDVYNGPRGLGYAARVCLNLH